MRPLTLYHATDQSFDDFDHNRSGLGTHFGTFRAAQFRLRHIAPMRGNVSSWTIKKFAVSIRNPLRLPDAAAWESEADVENAFIRAGVMNRSDLPEARRYTGAKFWEWARSRIERAGHDAVVYSNAVEDRGHDSYVVWNSRQIRPLGTVATRSKSIVKRAALPNSKRPSIPAAIVKVRTDSRVRSVDDERADGNGWWVYLKHGWCNDADGHSLHGTASEVLADLKSIRRCDCEQCAAGGAWRQNTRRK